MTHARDALLPVRPRTTRGGSPPPVAARHPEQRVRISQPLAVVTPHPPMEARHPATRSNREAFTRDESLILLKGPNRWISNWRKSRSSGIRDHEISRFLNNLSTALVRSFFHNPIRFGIQRYQSTIHSDKRASKSKNLLYFQSFSESSVLSEPHDTKPETKSAPSPFGQT